MEIPPLNLVIMISATLFIPIVAGSYILSRLASRVDQLRNLFNLLRILEAYLASRGEDVTIYPNEDVKSWLGRLLDEFEGIFRMEPAREYVRGRFLIAITAAYEAQSNAALPFMTANWQTKRVSSLKSARK